MNAYVKQAIFILAVVAVAKFINNQLPANPLDNFLPS